MQIFVPCETFEECAASLDNARLLKQLVEVYQLLRIAYGMPKLDGSPVRGWLNHPALIMWKPWPGAMARYADAIADECDRRGIKTGHLREQLAVFSRDGPMPEWWGDPSIHSSHRSRLLQKDFEKYRSHDWPEQHDPLLSEREYWWAVPSPYGGYSLRQKAGAKLSQPA
jgi:hypothetical protein